jgi:RNA polymerase sigma-70 factor (ECF subfamily)
MTGRPKQKARTQGKRYSTAVRNTNSASVVDSADESLVARMAGGSASAAREMYRRLSPLVFSLAIQITGCEEDAEEVLIDSFMQIWTQAGRYDRSRATVTGWVVNIARSRAIDRVRARRRRQQREGGQAEPIASFPHFSPEDPEQQAMRGEERTRLRTAIGSLSPDQRRAVELAYFAGLSHSEIAEHLGQPLGTIKTRLRLAMKKIRIALSSVDGTEP